MRGTNTVSFNATMRLSSACVMVGEPTHPQKVTVHFHREKPQKVTFGEHGKCKIFKIRRALPKITHVLRLFQPSSSKL
jgi:hypothetical protein